MNAPFALNDIGQAREAIRAVFPELKTNVGDMMDGLFSARLQTILIDEEKFLKALKAAFCKKDFGMTYTEKCQQLTSCHCRSRHIFVKNKDLIKDCFSKGISVNTTLSKIGLTVASSALLAEYCKDVFGKTYSALSNATIRERKKKKAAQEKAARALAPRKPRDPNAKWLKKELLEEMSQVARPAAIARLWGCHVSVILKQQKKFGINSPMKRKAS